MRVMLPLLGILLVVSAVPAYADFEPESGWNGHLFPSYIVATATMKPPESDDDSDENALGDPLGLLGVSIEAEEDDQEVTVTITCDAIMEPSTITCTLPEAGETYVIRPKIKYHYDQLARRSQTGPITVTYEVEIDDETEEQSETVTLRSINDCPYSYAKGETWVNTRYMFAAYVNEQHPFVDKVLREALDTGIVDSFTGYQTKDEAEVYRQVYAIWHALSQRDVRYSNITDTVAASDKVGSQHIRLIDESINNGQANCVDGSVLMASMLRKVGIEPILVHVPGHCYLAFWLDEQGKSIVGLETTMIGHSIEGDGLKVKGLETVVDEDSQDENSWKTFAGAVGRGTANLAKYGKEFKDPANARYMLISVARARQSGILAIGFQSNQKFVGAPKGSAEESESDSEE